jgi:predicted chitinase
VGKGWRDREKPTAGLGREREPALDRGGSVEDVTLRVNGGYNGLDDRQHYYDKACGLFA